MGNDSAVKPTAGDTRGTRIKAKQGWIAVALVAATATAIILYKETKGRPPSGSVVITAPAAGVSAEPARVAAGSVLLFADPAEAEDACGCGQIIRLVREAAGRGVAVREVAPGSDLSLQREYRVTVAPTVLFLDSTGRVVARHEGEASETIEAIRSGLDRLSKAGG